MTTFKVTDAVGLPVRLRLYGGDIVTGTLEGYAHGMLFFTDTDEVDVSGIDTIVVDEAALAAVPVADRMRRGIVCGPCHEDGETHCRCWDQVRA